MIPHAHAPAVVQHGVPVIQEAEQHVALHAVPLTHCPFAPQVCGELPLHWVWVGPHTPMQAPPTHVWFVQVATGESDTRSGPHCTAVVALLQTS
jgi:hypothetical protein